MSDRAKDKRRRRARHSGVATLEVILCLPLLIIPTMAIVEFGMLYTNQQTLEMASRAGAERASKVSLPETGNIPASVLNAIDNVLDDANITAGCVQLEHNVNNPLTPANPPFVLTTGTLACPMTTMPPVPGVGQYVRVTVFAQSTELAPNVLKTFGFDLSNRVSQQTTTHRVK